MSEEILYKLLAFEPEGSFEPSYVSLVKAVTVGDRDDFCWAEWAGRSGKSGVGTDDRFVLVATRHHGYSLRELSNQPVHIYLCVVKDSELTLKEKLRADDVSILSWALMLMPGDARSDLKEILESMERKLGNVFYVNPVKK